MTTVPLPIENDRDMEWERERSEFSLTSSAFPYCCNLSPHKSRRQFFKEYNSPELIPAKDDFLNSILQRGHDMESYGIKCVEDYCCSQAKSIWLKVIPTNTPMPVPTSIPYALGCTPDGFVIKRHGNLKIPIEVKCPYRGIKKGFWLNPDVVVPHHYYIQMQTQMQCVDAPYALLCIIDVDEAVIIKVYRNQVAWQWIEDKVEEFLDLCPKKNHDVSLTQSVVNDRSKSSYFNGKGKGKDGLKMKEFQLQSPPELVHYHKNIFY